MTEKTMKAEPRESTQVWAIRSLAEVAQALTEALGDLWAEWGEGDLADGVRELTKQRDDALAGRPAQTVSVALQSSMGATWIQGVYASQSVADASLSRMDARDRSELQTRVKDCPVQGSPAS